MSFVHELRKRGFMFKREHMTLPSGRIIERAVASRDTLRAAALATIDEQADLSVWMLDEIEAHYKEFVPPQLIIEQRVLRVCIFQNLFQEHYLRKNGARITILRDLIGGSFLFDHQALGALRGYEMTRPKVTNRIYYKREEQLEEFLDLYEPYFRKMRKIA